MCVTHGNSILDKYMFYHISFICGQAILRRTDIRRIKMTNFDKYLKEQLENPEFKKEYDALEPEYAVIQAMIDARK